MSDAEFVVVRTYLNSMEAEMAHSALEAAGIESVIRSDDCGGLRPSLWMGGIGLLVPAEDVARAQEVLDTPATTAAE